VQDAVGRPFRCDVRPFVIPENFEWAGAVYAGRGAFDDAASDDAGAAEVHQVL
jgi:hypothetical protein